MYALKLSEPLNVSKVHTVWELSVVRIHTECELECTCVCRSDLCTECKHVTLALYNLQRISCKHTVVTLSVWSQYNELDSHCIVETLLVKLGAANRTEAVGIALRKNLVKV